MNMASSMLLLIRSTKKTLLRLPGTCGQGFPFPPSREFGVSHHSKSNYEKFYATVEKEQTEPLETTIKGEIPSWINGSLLRTGPGIFKVGKESYKHFFDGLAIFTRFNIHNGKVTYQSRFQRSDAYFKAMKQNRIVVSEFGTVAHPDPCLGIFGRFMARFKPQEFTDNCVVNVMTLGDECYAMSEIKEIRKFDPATLETLEKVDLSKKVIMHTASAHPHFDHDGTVFNLGTHYARKTHYNIMKIPLPDPGVKTDPIMNASLLCSIPASGRLPSYYHSFGFTDNYIIFLEQPLVVNVIKLQLGKFTGEKALGNTLEFQENNPARFHVIKRDTGELLNQTFLADAFFCFHHINAYEESGHVVIDLICYKDASIMNDLRLENITNGELNAFSDVRRFVLPLRKQETAGVNLNTLVDSKATAVLQSDGSLQCKPEVVCSTNCELPTINYKQYNGKPYRYFYGIGGNFSELLKGDTKTGMSQSWGEDGRLSSEPIFVGAPGSTSEDDGVVLAAIMDNGQGKLPFLVVLDARDMKEIGRAEINAEVPYGIHGMFLAS